MILLRSFLDSLQNCWQPTAVHKSDVIIHLINIPSRMFRGREKQACRIVTGTSLVIMT